MAIKSLKNSTIKDNRFHRSMLSGNPKKVSQVILDMLLVAGGGAGNFGGGGAGGYREISSEVIQAGVPINVTVGAGGAKVFSAVYPGSGQNSVFDTQTASGGGAGAPGGNYSGDRTGNMGVAGGSGGGAGQYFGTGGTGNIGGYTPVEGYRGGATPSYLQAYGGAGGGGAGQIGADGTGSSSGSGGAGRASSITGTSIYRGGGGAGGGRQDYPKGSAGIGGGGSFNSPGTANTGGGGGGRGTDGLWGESGGSGVVIIKYPDTASLTVGAGLVSSTVSSGGFKVTTFTAGSDTVIFG